MRAYPFLLMVAIALVAAACSGPDAVPPGNGKQAGGVRTRAAIKSERHVLICLVLDGVYSGLKFFGKSEP